MTTTPPDSSARSARVPWTRRARRALDAAWDRIGMRPLGLVVFLISAATLVALHLSTARGPVQAPAVGHAPALEHPSRIDSVVAEVHVQPGDVVTAGTPLVTLAPERIERELRQLAAELVELETLAALEQARLERDYTDRVESLRDAILALEQDASAADSDATRAREVARAAARQHDALAERIEKRTVPAGDLPELAFQRDAEDAALSDARRRARAVRAHLDALETRLAELPTLPEVAHTTDRHFAARLELLRVRQQALREDLARATIVATRDGRVLTVANPGQAVPIGTSVATVLPGQATEIIAYLPPDTPPSKIVAGAEAAIVNPAALCSDPALVLRTGAAVVEAPGQLRGLLRAPVHGTPVYLSVPADCQLGAGQVLQVELGIQ